MLNRSCKISRMIVLKLNLKSRVTDLQEGQHHVQAVLLVDALVRVLGVVALGAGVPDVVHVVEPRVVQRAGRRRHQRGQHLGVGGQRSGSDLPRPPPPAWPAPGQRGNAGVSQSSAKSI